MSTIHDILSKNNIWLAPMAGVTDMPFRALCKRFGCGLTCTEMVSAKALHYQNERTQNLLVISPDEVPCAVQIFGNDPSIMAEESHILEDIYSGQIACIDINMGCPAPKITSNGEGSALMKSPATAGLIINRVVQTVSLPVTVKFRKGWDDQHVNAVEFARICEDNGAAALTIHGRTREQFYRGKADWDIISQVKQAVRIPVLGNGDIFCAQDAERMFTYTGVDGIMVARGAQGNPWIFEQISAYMEKGVQMLSPHPRERIETALQHATDLTCYKGERAIVEMRKHVAWYIKDMPDSAKIRNAVNQIQTLQSLKILLREYCDMLEQ